MSTIATHADCTVWKVEFDLKFDILLHFSYAWSIHSCRCWSCAASERTDRSEAAPQNLTLRSHLSPSYITPHPSLSHIIPHPSPLTIALPLQLSPFIILSLLSSFTSHRHPSPLTSLITSHSPSFPHPSPLASHSYPLTLHSPTSFTQSTHLSQS